MSVALLMAITFILGVAAGTLVRPTQPPQSTPHGVFLVDRAGRCQFQP